MTSSSNNLSPPLYTFRTDCDISPGTTNMLKKRPLHDITNQNMNDNNTSTPIKKQKQLSPSASSDKETPSINSVKKASSFINFTANNISDASTQYYSSRKISGPQLLKLQNSRNNSPRSLSVVPVESLLLPDDQSPTSGSVSPNLFQLHRDKDNKSSSGSNSTSIEKLSNKVPKSEPPMIDEPKKHLQLPYHADNSVFESTVDPNCSVFSAVDPKSGIQLSMMSFNAANATNSSLSSSSKLESLPDSTTNSIDGDSTIDEFIATTPSKQPSGSIRGHYKIQSLYAKAKSVSIPNLPQIQVPQSVFSTSLKAFLSHISAHKYHFKQHINQNTLQAASNTMSTLYKSPRKTIFKLTISQLVQLLLLYRHAFRITRYENLKMYLYCGCGKTISCGMKFCLAFDTGLQLGFIWKTSNDLGVPPFGHGVEDILHLCDLKTFGLESLPTVCKTTDSSNSTFATNVLSGKLITTSKTALKHPIPILPNLHKQQSHVQTSISTEHQSKPVIPIPKCLQQQSSAATPLNNRNIDQLTEPEKQRLMLIFNQALCNPSSFPADCQEDIKNMVNCSKTLFDKWQPYKSS